VKRICHYLPLFSLLLVYLPLANAQSAVDFGLGFGYFHDKAAGGGIDNINSVNAFGSCTVGAADPNCVATPKLSSVFMGFGGDVMLTKRYGFGMWANITPGKSDYAGLQFRQWFYDFDGIYAPINEKKVVLQLMGGIGGAKTSFSYTQNSCVGTAVCSSYSQPVGNSSHFQVHAGVGVQVFVTEHVFVKPEFDFHYVPNLTQQFGSNSVPGFMVWVGYSLGDR